MVPSKASLGIMPVSFALRANVKRSRTTSMEILALKVKLVNQPRDATTQRITVTTFWPQMELIVISSSTSFGLGQTAVAMSCNRLRTAFLLFQLKNFRIVSAKISPRSPTTGISNLVDGASRLLPGRSFGPITFFASKLFQ